MYIQGSLYSDLLIFCLQVDGPKTGGAHKRLFTVYPPNNSLLLLDLHSSNMIPFLTVFPVKL